MRILADENIDRPIVHWLREQGHDVVETVQIAPGARDADLVQMSRDDNRTLMTFDRDIGRIILSQHDPHPGVIYLRLHGAGPSCGNASNNSGRASRRSPPAILSPWGIIKSGADHFEKALSHDCQSLSALHKAEKKLRTGL